MERKTYTLNAQGRSLGRLAVEVALLLRGKQKGEFSLEKDAGDFVTVQNFSRVRFTGRKPQQKHYFRHSGYIGSLKATSLDKLFENRPQEVLRRAVWGMLPNNKLRTLQIKRLKVEL
ncbi:MAG: 50S ribosomal protein L13 [Candidatus Wildermuthbacteria bacterium RIFCSPHIGHO2_02_FULL_49_9]|uniref:Large ribosomal subunit protein uL13 n=2 Tax=Candidatus Wildermuthiibacteriota TaxID=1817923 RepID=A0A1G2QXX1_9BACT|nr:MAG: 50S ribosomal protein L13 [Candidatus Wildermuthbacteria bacterium RIFCSPHIGHO2_01_FULL_49_22b]OHA70094.1 MAG: 50S ribosomal protein L13 [Candidatus Wildermuthbacteria bacterium RIFCSPHIGHO2_02_FULL_49_9]